LADVVSRHEMLRTRIEQRPSGELLQIVENKIKMSIRDVDLLGCSQCKKDSQIELLEGYHEPNAEQTITVVQTGRESYIVIFNLDTLYFDRCSLSIVARDLYQSCVNSSCMKLPRQKPARKL